MNLSRLGGGGAEDILQVRGLDGLNNSKDTTIQYNQYNTVQ